jgi:hypothetical protein
MALKLNLECVHYCNPKEIINWGFLVASIALFDP